MLTLLSKGVPTKIFKFFWLKIFFICHRCQRHRWSTLICEYLREFSKKFETILMGYSGAGGKLIHEKNQEQKISWHCPFKVGDCEWNKKMFAAHFKAEYVSTLSRRCLSQFAKFSQGQFSSLCFHSVLPGEWGGSALNLHSGLEFPIGSSPPPSPSPPPVYNQLAQTSGNHHSWQQFGTGAWDVEFKTVAWMNECYISLYMYGCETDLQIRHSWERIRKR